MLREKFAKPCFWGANTLKYELTPTFVDSIDPPAGTVYPQHSEGSLQECRFFMCNGAVPCGSAHPAHGRFSAEYDLARAYDAQIAAYLVKPLNLDAYFGAIRAIKEFWFNVVTLVPKARKASA